ncbi:hypothetical protein A2U01_0024337, partial [Trifolium medium]|nr:hypothetical protein [Trifolium medium]
YLAKHFYVWYLLYFDAFDDMLSVIDSACFKPDAEAMGLKI